MSALGALLRRDLRLAWRQKGEALLVVAFFLLAAVLFPFGVGPEPDLLRRIAAGVLWVAALFSVLLSLERLFAEDYGDGTLEQLLLSPLALPLLVLGKALVHWLTTGLALVVAAPVILLLYDLPRDLLGVILLALLLGTPTLSLVGAVGAALVLGARRGGVLLPLLLLPLMVPVLILGVLAIEAASSGLSPRPHLLLLGAGFLIALPVAALAGPAALRQALD